MKKRDNQHPEVKEMENICNITPTDKKTKDICQPLKKEQQRDKKS